MKCFNFTLQDLVPNQMTINFYMFGSFMENRVSSYVQSWLSQNNIAGLWWSVFKSLSSCITQVISQATLAIALYSASAEDLDTTPCFLDF